MTTATMGTETSGRWCVQKPDKHVAGRSRRRPLRADADQHDAAGRGTRDCAEQVADAARMAAQAERHRLARDLHDSVTQTLISLHLTAQAAADLWDTQPAQARTALDTLRYLASGATTEMRALLVDLHDAVLEQQGLIGALEVHCAVVRQRSGLQVELRAGAAGSAAHVWTQEGGERLPVAHEEALYRIVQEALANVVKHARATRATVTLVQDTTVRIHLRADDYSPQFGLAIGFLLLAVAALVADLATAEVSIHGYLR